MCYPGHRIEPTVKGWPSMPLLFETLVLNQLSQLTYILHPDSFLTLLASDLVTHFPFYSLTHSLPTPASLWLNVYLPLKLWSWFLLWLYRLHARWVNTPTGSSLSYGHPYINVPPASSRCTAGVPHPTGSICLRMPVNCHQKAVNCVL